MRAAIDEERTGDLTPIEVEAGIEAGVKRLLDAIFDPRVAPRERIAMRKRRKVNDGD